MVKKPKKPNSEHWEIKYSVDQKESNNPSDALNPKIASDRPCTHTKINKQDH